MTTIEIVRKKNRIVSYKSFGHTGYSDIGSDIVCASLSTALQFPLYGVQSLKYDPQCEIKDGYLFVDIRKLNLTKEDSEKIDFLTNSMLNIIKELANQYPSYIKIVEKEED